MTGRSTKLQTQLAEIMKADDIEQKLAALADRLRKEDASKFAADIELLGRLPGLLASVDKSYADFEKKAQIATDSRARDSAELDSASAELHALHLSLSAIFDSLEQGIFTFGADGICHPVYSKPCIALLEGSPAGRRVVDFLHVPVENALSTDMLIKIIFAGTHAPAFFEDFFALLPKTFQHSKGMTVSLSYRPIFEFSGALQSILVIATDHTHEATEQKLRLERETAALAILRMSSNRNMFTHFFLTATSYFSAGIENLSDHVPLINIKRDIHTLKGNASIFYLRDLVDILHNIEIALENAKTMEEARAVLASRMLLARGALSRVRDEAAKILGDDFDRQGSTRTVPLDLLRSFAVELRASGSGNAALAERFVTLLMGEQIHKVLSGFDIGLQELSERYRRRVGPCIFTGENFTIYPENYEALFASFVHIERNIIAHAIDDLETRVKWNKPPNMTITIDTARFERMGRKWFRITFTDDGLGINTVRIRRKLKQTQNEKSVDLISEDEIMQYIFNDELSTSDEVSELAGRGIGMSAVRKEVLSLGGKVRADSELHRYTRITVEVPMLWA